MGRRHEYTAVMAALVELGEDLRHLRERVEKAIEVWDRIYAAGDRSQARYEGERAVGIVRGRLDKFSERWGRRW